MRVNTIREHSFIHIWEAYAQQLLKENPEYWAVPKRNSGVKYPAIYKNHKNRVIEVMSYERFCTILEVYLGKAKDAIINGELIQFTYLGKMCAIRQERNFNRPKIDQYRTRQQPLVPHPTIPGKFKRERIVYFTQDDYCMIKWFKGACLSFKMYFEFKPAKKTGNVKEQKTVSFSQAFSEALKERPLLKYKYLFFSLNLNKL